jgi:amino acid transporter
LSEANTSGIAGPALPESVSYRFKRLLLGKPLVSEQLHEERLGLPTAWGVLAPDCISSSSYGTEEMLVILVPVIGLAAFNVVLGVTAVILGVLLLVTLSYREVVMVYTKAGGSYVVARENFGVKVAQVAAVALLVDYTVTVAVQVAAGTDALASAVPALGHGHDVLIICLVVVALMLWGNLRGIREAGRAFALPLYLYIAGLGSTVVVGVVRVAMGQTLPTVTWKVGHITIGTHVGNGLLLGASLFVFLKAFANGGSSLTGLEAISNGVSALRPPEGRHARRLLALLACTLGGLVLGVTLLAHWTHAIPYKDGFPTVVSQVVHAVFGTGAAGSVFYYYVLFASVLILWTGGNTSFNGFPFLASFVAEDAFLPRMLTKRGHRLSFSNGIIVLALAAMALLIVTRANLDALIGVYAIGVFTGFTFAGAGLTRYHLRHRGPGWHHRVLINGASAVCSFTVVFVFLITKFTEGAWAVFVIFLIGVPVLVRLNREYREEDQILGSGTALLAASETTALRRNVAFVLVDRVDLATGRAVQYAKTLNVDVLRAVHFVVDVARARELQEGWRRLGLSGMPLELIECPDRRVVRACVELAYEEAADGETEVSLLLPRRAYRRLVSRFMHDQTAERISAAVSRLPHVSATIVPFDVSAALESRRRRLRRAAAVAGAPVAGVAIVDQAQAGDGGGAEDRETAGLPPAASVPGAEGAQVVQAPVVPTGPLGSTPVSHLQARQHARVVGRVRSMVIKPWGTAPTLECTVADGTGRLVVAFLGRREIAGLEPGSQILVEGTVAARRGQLVMINPAYELLTSALEA